MASSSPAHPDTPVTLKISFLGSTRRLTLPLHEVSSCSLLDKIRQLLSISSDANAVFERHSDSAAAYVELDPDNIAVWKQLTRAAKAKRKLKLRVTLHDSEDGEDDQSTHGPKPVTVEDEPEQHSQDSAPLLQTPVSAPVAGNISVKTSSPSLTQIDTSLDLEKAMSNLQLHSDKSESNDILTYAKSMCAAPKAANFAVCCNNCDRTIPDAHYHCSTCDEGDFDLCPACVEMGITCYNSDHWLLKRFVRGDFILVSTTERVSPQSAVKKEESEEKPLPAAWTLPTLSPKPTPPSTCVPVPAAGAAAALRSFSITPMRTCNSCVQELPDREFLHCLCCEDFDLCKACFTGDQHGHHPQHAFAPAVEGTAMPSDVLRRLAPGRDRRHHAICDGCDNFIFGIRHKCLDCPDWDYCADCVLNAGFVHPGHRFVPIYEQIADIRTRTAARPSHYGICCDGPLCNGSRKTYIVGDRFKCAVCHDTDFCAQCEASPANTHNKTHPLIKFKTPVRRVEVTTKGEDAEGQQMPTMGDRLRTKAASPIAPQPVADIKEALEADFAQSSASQKSATEAMQRQRLAMIQAQHAQILKAHEQARTHAQTLQQSPFFEVQRKVIEDQRQVIAKTAAVKPTPIAIFERDTVADGTVMPPNQVFEQTWVLRNGGDAPWPAGCSVKFVGGDYMGHVDSSHPAGIHDLVSASESTVCYDALAPGQEFPFTVLLRTPAREGKVISYWRLQSDDGLKFGHRLWCDVSVQNPKAVEAPKVAEASNELALDKGNVASQVQSQRSADSSQMIFPKLGSDSVHHIAVEEDFAESLDDVTLEPSDEEDNDEFEMCGDDEAWAEDSDDGVLTDEEYDILDASDEETSLSR